MKSGPTLAAPTVMRRERATISPVATVVLPAPEWGAATTSRGVRSINACASALCGRLRVSDTGKRPQSGSVLDALDGFHAFFVGVLDLAHLGGGVGDVDELLGRIAAGDDDVGLGGAVPHGGDDFVHIHPAVLHGVGELVEDEELVVA